MGDDHVDRFEVRRPRGDAAEVGASARGRGRATLGLTPEKLEGPKVLERKNLEIRRVNEILKSAAALFGAVQGHRNTHAPSRRLTLATRLRSREGSVATEIHV